MSSDEDGATGLGLCAKRLGRMGRMTWTTAHGCEQNNGHQAQQQISIHRCLQSRS